MNIHTQSSQRQIIAYSYWVSTFCEGASRILIPLYFSSIGISVSKIAVLFVFYEVFGLLTNLSCGYFINKFGYKKAFVVSLILHTIASIGYIGLFKGPLIVTIVLVNILRSFRGIGKELIKTTASAYFRHLSNSHLHPHLLLGGKDSLKGIGVLIGGIMMMYISFITSFVVLGVLTGLCLIGAILWVDDYRDVKQVSYKKFTKVRPNLKYLALSRACIYAGRDLWLVLAIPIYLQSNGVSAANIGFILAVGLVIFGVFQPLTGFFVKWTIKWQGVTLKEKWAYEDILVMGSILLAGVPILMTFNASNTFAVFGLIVLYNILAAFVTAPHNYLHIRLAQKERASIDIAYYKSVSQIGKVVAVLASGLLYDSFGLMGCLWASVASIGVSAILSYVVQKNYQAFLLQNKSSLPDVG